jgi:hypothetical protein
MRGKAEGAVWRRIAKHVLDRDRRICWVCLHPGATGVDHVIPVTERPDLELAEHNLKAIHAAGRGHGACPVCSAAAEVRGQKAGFCNEVKGAMSVERARRIIEARTGLTLLPQGQARPDAEREWLPGAHVPRGT